MSLKGFRALITDSRFDARYGPSGLTPLVGRDEEVDLLLRRWSLARDGEGQVVLLSGEPGIGKSRILSTFREQLEERRSSQWADPRRQLPWPVQPLRGATSESDKALIAE